jgi:hypothetical protein
MTDAKIKAKKSIFSKGAYFIRGEFHFRNGRERFLDLSPYKYINTLGGCNGCQDRKGSSGKEKWL